MPKRVHQKQKQKQTVVVNINSSKTKTRTKRKTSKNPAGSQQQIIRQQIPAPIHQVYTSPIHNTVPQIFSSAGNRLTIPTLAEQQINNMLNPASNAIPTGNRLGSPPLSTFPSSNAISTGNRLGSPPLSTFPSSNATLNSSSMSYPSSNATANSSSSSRSLTDYGSSNSPSLNSLAYFKNQHSDSSLGSDVSSLGSDVSSLGSDVSSFYNKSQKGIREHQEFLRKLADDEKKLKIQYSEVLDELSSNPIMKEQPENKSLASSVDSEIEYYAEKPNYDEIQSLESNPILREQPDNQSLASSITYYDQNQADPNQLSVFDRLINAPREQPENPVSLFDRVVNEPRQTPVIQRSITDYFNVEQPQRNVEQTPIIEPPIRTGQVDEISSPFTYKMKKKTPK